ncbi:MAG: molybdenum cofactor guanylyltransferase [Acidobacteriota bacterium]|jgi:molybdopterin-guanine dinucleotide biosynthesis protein A|nr:molybdenum cofactor guanylyltransferase [Acidobacteriota bacterium]
MLTYGRAMNCYVLVGGRSSRMGQSKTALFLDRVVAAARPVFDDVIAVQRAGGDTVGIRTICEMSHEDEAPLFGIARALEDAQADCFILAVDYPKITTDVLRYLADRDGVPVWNGQPQPLCARWPRALLPLVTQRLATRRYDLRGLIAEAGVEMIAEADLRARFTGEPLANVNTPADLQEAERHG